MYLEELFDYKNQFVTDVISNPTILTLLSDEAHPKNKPEDFVYTQVFPYLYIPDTVEYGYTFVCCEVEIAEVYTKTVLQPKLTIWVFSHQSRLRLPEGGVRTDKICCEINKMINGSRYYGLGELELHGASRFYPITDYQGKSLTYYATEWNRKTPTMKPVPANRKRGV